MTDKKQNTHPLQTREWAQFRGKWGNEIEKIPDGYIVFSKIPSKLTIATFIKGPKPSRKQINDLKKICREKNAVFVKIEPNWIPSNNSEREKTVSLLKKNGFVTGKTLFTPTTFLINLAKTESQLLSGFNSKTRYNIRYAIKKGVSVKEDNSQKAFENYIELMRSTVERQNFFAHSEKYHRLMWEHLHTRMVEKKQKPIARLLTASFKNTTLTAWIVFVYDNVIYYPYGASTDKHKNLQPNSLMMWEAIRYGKSNNCTHFDLWGREEGKGFTKFKEGFNPKVVEFIGTWDLPLSILYRPYRAAETVRWWFLRNKNIIFKQKPKF